MSRPTRAGTAGRNVTIRATDEERERWSAAAVCLDLGLSDWARPALDSAAIKVHATVLPEIWGTALRSVRRKRKQGAGK